VLSPPQRRVERGGAVMTDASGENVCSLCQIKRPRKSDEAAAVKNRAIMRKK
jgi:hypothetical protein